MEKTINKYPITKFSSIMVNDENDINLELVNVTKILQSSKNPMSISIKKTLYYMDKYVESNAEDEEVTEEEINTESSDDEEEKAGSDIMLTYEFPFYGHFIKNLKIVQNNKCKPCIISCEFEAMDSDIVLYEQNFDQPVKEVVITRNLIPIIKLLQDNLQVSVRIVTTKGCHCDDFELQHEVMFCHTKILEKIRKFNKFVLNDEEYAVEHGRFIA